jgi:hypothetical protein
MVHTRVWREYIDYSQLHQFDIVLIRSKVVFNGCDVDAGVGRSIMFASSDIHVSEEKFLSKWDRVGLLQLPSFVSPQDYDIHNLEVTEATHEGLRTTPMREILQGALEVSIRSMRVAGDEEEAEGDVKSNPIRVDFEEQFFGFLGPLMNKPYAHPLVTTSGKLDGMFQNFAQTMQQIDFSPKQLKRLHEEVAKADKGNGIQFDELLELFTTLFEAPELLNTLSTAEILSLTSHYDISEDKKEGISKDEFIETYNNSIKRTLIARKMPREVLSGAFVSLVFQELGLLKKSKSNYLLPMAFAQQSLAEDDNSPSLRLVNANLGVEMLVPSLLQQKYDKEA